MLSIIRRPALPGYVSCDVWCVWCGICAMLMTVITELIRVIRNQLWCPLSISARPLFTQQQSEDCSQLSVIANIPEEITQWCQAQNSDGMTSHYPHDGWSPSLLMKHRRHVILFVLFVFLSVWPSINLLALFCGYFILLRGDFVLYPDGQSLSSD